MKKLILIVISFITLNANAAQPNTQPDLKTLQAQLNVLQKQVDALNKKVAEEPPPAIKATTNTSNTGGNNSILELDRVNPYASMSKAAFAYQALKAKDNLNSPLVFGGSFEGDIQAWGGNYALRSAPNAVPTYQKGSSVAVTKTYLFTAANINDYTTAIVSLLNGPLRGGPAIMLDRGFIIFGNLDKFPLYLTVGRNYFPFGQFSGNGQLDNGLTTNAFRMNQINQAVLSFAKDFKNYGYFTMNAGVYQNNNYSQSLSNYGVDAKYTNKIMAVTYSLGASYLNDLRGVNSDIGGAYMPSPSSITNPGAKPILAGNRNDAADFYGSLSYKAFGLLAEYVTTLKSAQEIVPATTQYQDTGRLSAWLLGGTYKNTIFNLPTLYQLSYSKTHNMRSIPFQLSGNYVNAYKSDIGMDHMWLGSITTQVLKNVYLGPELEYITLSNSTNTWSATLDLTAYF